MIKLLIKIKNSTFSVSNSIVDAIIKNNINFQVINYKGKQIHLLDDSCLPPFITVPTTSSTHFFIKIRNSAKLRVNKLFFEFIVLHSKRQNIEKTHNIKLISSSLLDKFYTKH